MTTIKLTILSLLLSAGIFLPAQAQETSRPDNMPDWRWEMRTIRGNTSDPDGWAALGLQEGDYQGLYKLAQQARLQQEQQRQALLNPPPATPTQQSISKMHKAFKKMAKAFQQMQLNNRLANSYPYPPMMPPLQQLQIPQMQFAPARTHQAVFYTQGEPVTQVYY